MSHVAAINLASSLGHEPSGREEGIELEIALRELGKVFGEGAADFASKDFRQRRDAAGGFIESETFDAGHRKKERRQAGAFAIGAIDLIDEVIERVQIDAAQRDTRSVDREKFAPEFFLGRVQTDDDDGVRFHGSSTTA